MKKDTLDVCARSHSRGQLLASVLTKAGVLAHVLSILGHTLPQEALRLGVARTLHLPPDFGHRAEHGELGSGCWVGLEVF